MKDWVKRRLDEIDDLFPENRLARSKARWQRLWQGEPRLDRHPFFFSHIEADPWGVPRSHEEWLRSYLDDIIARDGVEDDFIPSIWSGCRVSIMPSLFGAKEVVRGNDYSPERIIRTVADIDSLPEAAIRPGTPAHEVVELQRYLVDETEGRIPIHVVDMQGPADVCGKMWGYDHLFLCAHEQPECYHRLMRKAADAFVLFWKRQEHILGECFVNSHLSNWVPRAAGAAVSFDSLVMVSPSFYDEFCRPYVAKIGEALGGVTTHACGKFPAAVRNLCRTPHLRGIDASEMSAEELARAGMDGKVVGSMTPPVTDAQSIFDSVRRHSLRIVPWFTGLWPATPSRSWTGADWMKIRDTADRVAEAAGR